MAGHVFVSYSRTDQAYVDRLVAFLRECGLDVWVDQEIQHGSHWLSVVSERIDTCGAFVIIMTPEAERSEWVLREINRAEQGSKRILPMLLTGNPIMRLNNVQFESVLDGGMPRPVFVDMLRRLTNAPAPAVVAPPAPAPMTPPPATTDISPAWATRAPTVEAPVEAPLFPVPAPALEMPFLMAITDVFKVKGRGVVAVGRIERGVVRIHDEVAIVGHRERSTTAVVAGINESLDQARAGEDMDVGLLLDGVGTKDVERGMVVAKPGSISAHKRFEATHDVGEAGHGALANGRPLDFKFRNVALTGRGSAGPDDATLAVDLVMPAALEVGLGFEIHAQGRQIGTGVVTRVL